MILIPGIWFTDTPLRGQGSTKGSSVRGFGTVLKVFAQGTLFFFPATIEEIKQQQQPTTCE